MEPVSDSKILHCSCGFWYERSALACPDCGDPNPLTMSDEAAAHAVEYKRSSKVAGFGGIVGCLSATVALAGTLGETAIVQAVGVFGVLIGVAIWGAFEPRKKKKQLAYHEVQEQYRETSWRSREARLQAQLTALHERLQGIRAHQEEVGTSTKLEEPLREKLLGTLRAAESALHRKRPRLERQLDLFPFMRWQNQWVPLKDMMNSVETAADCQEVLDHLHYLRDEAKGLDGDFPELAQAMEDLGKLEATIFERLEGVQEAELVAKTMDLVQDLQPIDVELPADLSASTPDLELEKFPWFYESADVEAQAEELEDELRRLQAELAVEAEFPLNIEDRTLNSER